MSRRTMGPRGIQCVALCYVLLLYGCNGDSRLSTPAIAPSAPSTPSSPAPPPSSLANWRGDATVLSVKNPGRACGWGTTVGETRTGVDWRVTISGGSISLDEDMRNWPTDHIPFTGALTGRQFTAAYKGSDDYLEYVCQFRGATLTGSFSEDFSSFEALETLAWGPPDGETTVHRRWTGSRF